jgi:hypothetical protein
MQAQRPATGAALVRVFVGAVVLLALSALPATAAPRPGERVVVMACPYRGAVSSCLMLNAADGTVYNITGASPKPRLIDRMIRLRGAVTDKASMCGQGVVLDRIRWTRVRQKCPN